MYFSKSGYQYFEEGSNKESIIKETLQFLSDFHLESESNNQVLWDAKICYDHISRKQLHDWIKTGLIKKPQTVRYRFSIVELVWINIIHRARGFGFNNKQLEILKKSLSYFKTEVEYPLLEYGIHLSRKGVPIFLLISDDGNGQLVNGEDLSNNIFKPLLHYYQSVCLISLNGIMMEMGEHPYMRLETKDPLSDQEKEVIDHIRIKDFENTSVVTRPTKSGKNRKFLEGTKSIISHNFSTKDISENLRNIENGSITIDRHNHRNTKITTSEKKMLD